MKTVLPLLAAGILIASGGLAYVSLGQEANAAPKNLLAGNDKPGFRADWIAQGGDLNASGYVPGKLGEQRFGDAAWTFALTGMRAPSDFVVSGGKAYFFAPTKNRNGVELNGIVAVDVATGKTDWAWNDRAGYCLIGINKGYLYAIVGEEQTRQLISVALKDGKAKWRKDLQSVGKDSFLTSKGVLWYDGNFHLSSFEKGDAAWDAMPMLIPDIAFAVTGEDICLVGSAPGKGVQMALINGKSGKDISSFTLPDGPHGGSSAGIWCSGGKFIYGSRGDELVCADPKKGALTVRKTGAFPYRPTYTTNAIYACDGGLLRSFKPDTLDQIAEFDATSVKAPPEGRKVTPMFGQPVVTDDSILAGTENSTLVLSRDRLTLLQEISSGTLPVVAGNALFTWKPADVNLQFENGPTLVASKWTLSCHLMRAETK